MDIPESKKRGRKPKTQKDIVPVDISSSDDDREITPTQNKKRGRKPKGGKIVECVYPIQTEPAPRANIILYLKCFLADLVDANAPQAPADDTFYFIGDMTRFEQKKQTYNADDLEESPMHAQPCNTGDVFRKLKMMQNMLHVNNIGDKRSNCFWCTCGFTDHPVYIPQSYTNKEYIVYGNFCSPECAAAFLFEEKLDTSKKYERFSLLNYLYRGVFGYDTSIRPAPSPYYLLDKFFGNMNIAEYRELSRSRRLILSVNKPMSRVLPELYEEFNDFIAHNKCIQKYKL